MTEPTSATSADRAKWRRYLADERAEAAVYRELAARREGEEREILLALAAAEGRHEAHWLRLLDGDGTGAPRADIRTRILVSLARIGGISRIGSISECRTDPVRHARRSGGSGRRRCHEVDELFDAPEQLSLIHI